MLYLLTGNKGAGKTTWLEGFIVEMTEQNVPLSGFYSPGVFADGEKTGIQTVLLPSFERMLLAEVNGGWSGEGPDGRVAQRGTGAVATDSTNANALDGAAVDPMPPVGAAADSENAKAEAESAAASGEQGKTLKTGLDLFWRFYEDATSRVNDHMRSITKERPAKGILIVDEVGFLEFDENNGFTEAMRVLDEHDYANAIVTMRPSLLENAKERLKTPGEDICVLTPQSAHPAFR